MGSLRCEGINAILSSYRTVLVKQGREGQTGHSLAQSKQKIASFEFALTRLQERTVSVQCAARFLQFTLSMFVLSK